MSGTTTVETGMTEDAAREKERELKFSKMNADIENLRMMTIKTALESAKLANERKWYPVLVATGLVGATAAVVKIFF